jgi:hypothetical protein
LLGEGALAGQRDLVSSRIERGVTRGSDSAAANQDGLAAAYAGMTAGA